MELVEFLCSRCYFIVSQRDHSPNLLLSDKSLLDGIVLLTVHRGVVDDHNLGNLLPGGEFAEYRVHLSVYFLLSTFFSILNRSRKEFPDLLSCIHIVIEPCVPGPCHFVKPHLTSAAWLGIFVGDGPMSTLTFHIEGIGDHIFAAVALYPVIYCLRNGDICTPSTFVLKVSCPIRYSVLGAMYLKKWYWGWFGIFLRHPRHGKPGNRGYSLECLLAAVGEQIAHLSTI